ncbi:HpcH/HpaI aldolase/citrate lyase family protein [Bordetella genomosp. 12]|uniref:CoA ester lyase n=1 Tax=Bordetella genomosp. 12 TaxID=463035 RepID=A0A261VL43_9BORD|nr:CoA ester lyase [Bordetella genomosp. 12]OZI74856.1 CoA ester lyase [Bordetella genomosp. 12]
MTHPAIIRSLLFVPAASDRLLASALGRDCDGVILDLEDGTHPTLKEEARRKLPEAIGRLKAAGKCAAVRINGEWVSACRDLAAAITPGVDIVVLPKVEHPRDVLILARMMSTFESQAGMPPGEVRLLLQIESAAALPQLYDIASASPRAMGMMLGSEDYSLDVGALPTPDALFYPSMMVLNAARAAGIQPMGFIGSIAQLGSPEEFAVTLERAKSLGFRGAVIVHPKFIDVANCCYSASDAQLADARQLVAAFETAMAQGQGAIKLGDIMVDKPVYERALRQLAEAGR